MEVANRHALPRPWPDDARYIGRGTPLGNPFVIGRDGTRKQVIEKYREWLVARLESGATEVMDALRGLRPNTILVCSCAPKPCHGDVIRNIWQQKISGMRPLVYVFDTDSSGAHDTPAANHACRAFGAKKGVPEGIQGSAYALPVREIRHNGTRKQIRNLPLEAIGLSVRRFLAFARKHPDIDFRITPVGMETTSYVREQIEPMFRFAPDNCLLPDGWNRSQYALDRPVRLLIAGSRNFSDYALLQEKMALFTSTLDKNSICVISGMADGADTLGLRWAEENGIPVESFPAHWDLFQVGGAIVRQRGCRKYNARAGHDRNIAMLTAATHAVLFWDGKSPGTAHMMRQIMRAGGIDMRMVQMVHPPHCGNGSNATSSHSQETMGL